MYSDLLDFYVKVRGIFLNKEGKASCEYALEVEGLITYILLDSLGFKLFLRLMWEPLEEQFKSIELRFLNNADIIYRLAMIYSANGEHQNYAYTKEIQEREEGKYYGSLTLKIYINLGDR